MNDSMSQPIRLGDKVFIDLVAFKAWDDAKGQSDAWIDTIIADNGLVFIVTEITDTIRWPPEEPGFGLDCLDGTNAMGYVPTRFLTKIGDNS